MAATLSIQIPPTPQHDGPHIMPAQTNKTLHKERNAGLNGSQKKRKFYEESLM